MLRLWKTTIGRRGGRATLTRQAKALFLEDLQRITSYVDASALHESHIDPDSPARVYHVNFALFMQSYSPPSAATDEELAEYIRLLDCFHAEGTVKAEQFECLRQALIDAKVSRLKLEASG